MERDPLEMHHEMKRVDMQKLYKNDKLKFYIADVQGITSVKNVMHGVD